MRFITYSELLAVLQFSNPCEPHLPGHPVHVLSQPGIHTIGARDSTPITPGGDTHQAVGGAW